MNIDETLRKPKSSATDLLTRTLNQLTIKDRASEKKQEAITTSKQDADPRRRQEDLAKAFSRILRLSDDSMPMAQSSTISDNRFYCPAHQRVVLVEEPHLSLATVSSYFDPPRILEIIDLRDCPSIVWHASEFPWPTLDWIKILRFDFNKAYFEILQLYQAATATVIHWRAVLEMGKELISSAYLTLSHPPISLVKEDMEDYRGPSRSCVELRARIQIWNVKKEVWEAIIEFANSPLQQSLDELMVPGGMLDTTLLNEECNGLFQPWQETPETISSCTTVEHTQELPNPFDPILLEGVTMADLRSSADF